METLLPTFIIAVGVLLFAFAGIGIRVLFKKDKEFRGTCASKNPMLKDEIGDCPVCGGKVEKCDTNTAKA